jgi:hypothetical protein
MRSKRMENAVVAERSVWNEYEEELPLAASRQRRSRRVTIYPAKPGFPVSANLL